MSTTRFMGLLALLLLAAPAARADVGPPPSCPDGTHDEYLYGHHCVADGSHVVPGDGGWAVRVEPVGAPTSHPSASASAAAAPTAPATAPPAVPPKKSGCAMSAGHAADGGAIAGVLLALAAVTRRARRSCGPDRRPRSRAR